MIDSMILAQFHMTDGRIIRSMILEAPEVSAEGIRNEAGPGLEIEIVPLEDQIHGIMNPITLDGDEVAIVATKRVSAKEAFTILLNEGSNIK